MCTLQMKANVQIFLDINNPKEDKNELYKTKSWS
jgi:hypothetical protein